MGPFPHDAPPPAISDANPMGTDGFEFVEFCHPDPGELDRLFRTMGFAPVAKHRSQERHALPPGRHQLHSQCRAGLLRGARLPHGTAHPRPRWRSAWSTRSTPTSGRWRSAPSRRQRRSARWSSNIPAIEGIGGLQIYLVDRYGAKGSIYDVDFEWLGERDPKPEGVGLWYIDHLTHNVYRGRLDEWAAFYERLFNFRQIRYFDIEGKITGLHSRAMTSPDGKIRIPINEDAGETGTDRGVPARIQGRGHPARGAGLARPLRTIEKLIGERRSGSCQPRTTIYYARIDRRLPSHGEPIDRLRDGRHPHRRRGRGRRRLHQGAAAALLARPRSARSSSSSSSARATRDLARATSRPCSSPSRRIRSGAAC